MVTARAAPKTVIRDQIGDHLVTPKNSAMVVIDYHPASWLVSVRWIAICDPWRGLNVCVR